MPFIPTASSGASCHVFVNLIMVLGHSRCGAVEGAVKALKAGATYTGSIEDIIKAIQPSVEKVKGDSGDLLQN